MSLPTRERGLKYGLYIELKTAKGVAPYTGAWIEISCSAVSPKIIRVAPYTGAWIEIE